MNENKRTGYILLDGKVWEQEFPIDTYIVTLAWGQDFWRAFMCRPKLLRWIARIAMGKYAFRELYGMRDSIEKSGYKIWDGYELEDMEYHKDKIPT